MNDEKLHIESLTKLSLLAKNTGYNLLGQIAPLLAALVAIPILVHQLGAERFGVLGIAWVVLGYFGLFDLGLGRVITKMIAEKLGQNQEHDIAAIIWTGLGFMLLIGAAMMLLLLALTPIFVHSLLKIPAALQGESFYAFLILAACVPIVILTSGLRAILEAYQMFGIVNIIRTLNGILLYVAPLVILPFTQSIHYVVLVLTSVRLSILIFYAAACRRKIKPMQQKPTFQKSLLKPMLKLGGWMSVSNIIGPVMVYFDRFLMGIWLSVTAVAYYVTPYELISKAMVITTSVVRVLFPAFSMSIEADPKKASVLYSRGIRLLLIGFFPIILAIVIFALPAMTLWLGDEFAQQGAGVMKWLAIGIFINAPGQVAYAAIQAAGRPDITAKLHLVEMPFYVLMLFLFLKWFGITGAAMAWTVRLVIETFILFYYAEKLMCTSVPHQKSAKLILGVLISALCALLYIEMNIAGSLIVWFLIFVISYLFFWRQLVGADERHFVIKILHKARVKSI